MILVFDPERRYPIPRVYSPSVGAQSTRGVKNLQFLMKITIYLENGTR